MNLHHLRWSLFQAFRLAELQGGKLERWANGRHATETFSPGK